MSRVTKTAELIRRRIEAVRPGEPFTPSSFLACGTRASVDQSLSRLAKAGLIARVARGLYVRPESSRYVGKVMPAPAKIAESIAKSKGAAVQVHGAEAALKLGLTTQVPMQSVFLTTGPSRRLQVGKSEIHLRHVSPGQLVLAGRPAGLALAAMRHIGKAGVTPEVVAKIRRSVGPVEFEAIKSARGAMPSWMSDALYRHERSAGVHA